jgi:hypothetical protein
MRALLLIISLVVLSSCGNYKAYKDKRDSLINQIVLIEVELKYPTTKTDKFKLVLKQIELEGELYRLEY